MAMKHSDIEWIGDIPSDWEVKRLGFLFTFGKGLNITKEDLQDEGIPCVNYGEIHSKYGFEVNPSKNILRCVEKKYIKTDYDSLLNYGDFIFADTSEDIEGSGNFTYLNSDEKTFAGYHTIILRTISKLNYRYIAYCFDSILFRTQIRDKVWGIKVYSITKQILKNTKIILPSPKEQQAIVVFLDTQCSKIDSIVAELEQQIEIIKQYKTSLITETVTKGLNKNVPMKKSGVDWIGKIPAHWETRKIKYTLDLKSGDSLTNDILLDDDTLYPVFGGGKQIGYYEKSNVNSSNILIGRVGANCGCVTKIIGKAWATDNALIVYSNENLDYLYYLLLSADLNNMSDANAQPLITASKVLNIKISFCKDVKEQETIATFLDSKCKEITDIITEKQQSIDTMKAYKKSLIYEYVTGKKRVKGYT